MTESTSNYHRRRAAKEMAEADRHCDDITAEYHRRMAAEHRALAVEAEAAERKNARAEVPVGSASRRAIRDFQRSSGV